MWEGDHRARLRVPGLHRVGRLATAGVAGIKECSPGVDGRLPQASPGTSRPSGHVGTLAKRWGDTAGSPLAQELASGCRFAGSDAARGALFAHPLCSLGPTAESGKRFSGKVARGFVEGTGGQGAAARMPRVQWQVCRGDELGPVVKRLKGWRWGGMWHLRQGEDPALGTQL